MIGGLPMERDTHLVNIYLKIHNKRPLLMRDLRYLAKYDPECFEKTCKNVVHNIPEAKPIMEPITTELQVAEQASLQEMKQKPEDFGEWNIEQILNNIKLLEKKELPVKEIDVDKVKNLLGNLYMEMLFPHNGKETYINMPYEESKSKFDKKA